jgi:SAM-dependent methyltransferase
MKNTIHHSSNCRLCNSTNLKMVIPLKKIPITEKYITENILDEPHDLFPIDIYMCLDCSHVQLLDVINPDILWDDFTFRTGQAQVIIDHMKDVAKKTCSKYKIKKNSLIIDVGSNDGTLLQGFKDNGMTVLGIDPARDIAFEANNAGIPTLPEFLTPTLSNRIIKEYGKAKVVACFNSFGHADNMNELMESISDLVSKDGIFVFEVSYLVDIIDNLLLGTFIHEHLCHYSIIALVKFFKRHGMELIEVERVPFQGGSLIGTVQHIGGPHLIQKSVTELHNYEKTRGFDSPKTIESFSLRLDKLVFEFNQLISKWKNNGEEIAGYGAARSNPTLIEQFKIGNKISFIVDDHPQKVNKYTPGDKIPVIPTKELIQKMPKYTIILAWIHAENIISKSHEYLIKGGNFVILLPSIKIITAEDMI